MVDQQPESQKHEVRIHIDQRRHESPNPTTGEALYRLGSVAPGFVLYREVTGDREDKVIPDGPETMHLKEDEHFHSGLPEKKEIAIIVNGRKKEVTVVKVVVRPDRYAGFQPGAYGAEHHVHDHLQTRSPREPGRIFARGRHRQDQGWNDL